jgi:hypothetical protein
MPSFEIEVIESVQRYYTYEATDADHALRQFNDGDEPVMTYDASVLDYDVRSINGKMIEDLRASGALAATTGN